MHLPPRISALWNWGIANCTFVFPIRTLRIRVFVFSNRNILKQHEYIDSGEREDYKTCTELSLFTFLPLLTTGKNFLLGKNSKSSAVPCSSKNKVTLSASSLVRWRGKEIYPGECAKAPWALFKDLMEHKFRLTRKLGKWLGDLKIPLICGI